MKFINKLTSKLKKAIFPTEIDKWFETDGDNTLRLNYNLNENSVVFDLGGYIGEWSEKIYKKYNCNIYVFEPVPKYAKIISKKFKKNKKIKVFTFGLGPENEIVQISLKDNESSIKTIREVSNNTQQIKLVSIKKFFKENQIQKVNLMKINIEGAEYDLLENIINQKIINKIENLQVQFHKFVNHSAKKRFELEKKLKKTHHLTYKYDFVWENWKLKE
ncbi:MAG TPA: FkbM family methyltransferase [archaeon]|nr:FkbM family methyltransferase [archaeon]